MDSIGQWLRGHEFLSWLFSGCGLTVVAALWRHLRQRKRRQMRGSVTQSASATGVNVVGDHNTVSVDPTGQGPGQTQGGADPAADALDAIRQARSLTTGGGPEVLGALRLAVSIVAQLGMADDAPWIQAELNGYNAPDGEADTRLAPFRQALYRRVQPRLRLQFESPPQYHELTMPPEFEHRSLPEILRFLEQGRNEGAREVVLTVPTASRPKVASAFAESGMEAPSTIPLTLAMEDFERIVDGVQNALTGLLVRAAPSRRSFFTLSTAC